MSKTCQYAIRALVYLAAQDKDSNISIKDVAKENDLSYCFLGKIKNTLSQKNIIESFKGPNGGVKLARPANTISLLDIVRAIDGPEFQNLCLIGFPECNEEQSCPVHELLKGVREHSIKMLSSRTLENISRAR